MYLVGALHSLAPVAGARVHSFKERHLGEEWRTDPFLSPIEMKHPVHPHARDLFRGERFDGFTSDLQSFSLHLKNLELFTTTRTCLNTWCDF